jgi:hypothetical protein
LRIQEKKADEEEHIEPKHNASDSTVKKNGTSRNT